MFTPDGSHRADADIAVDVPKAISKLTTDGVITPQSAPTGPIRNFEDAQKYLDTLSASATATAGTSPKSIEAVSEGSALAVRHAEFNTACDVSGRRRPGAASQSHSAFGNRARHAGKRPINRERGGRPTAEGSGNAVVCSGDQ